MSSEQRFIEYPQQIIIDLNQISAFMPGGIIDQTNIGNNRYQIIFWMHGGEKLGWEFKQGQEQLAAMEYIRKVLKVSKP